MYDVLVIGAGITGAFISRELSRYKLKIVMVDKNSDVADGTTKANSAIIHAGYDARPGSLKAKLNVIGNPMFDRICEELDVHFKRIGSLVAAFNKDDMNALEELYYRGMENGLSDIYLIDKDKVRELEPNINQSVLGALYAPQCGIIGPFELAIALAENAMDNGVELSLNTEVLDIKKTGDAFSVETSKGTMEARYIINCAGVYADKISGMVETPRFAITPRRGQYYVLDKSAGGFVNSVVFQCPNAMGKGVLVLPTVHGNILVGPDSQYIDDKECTETTADGMNYVRDIAKGSFERIPFEKTITSFAGLRAAPDTGDFIIGESDQVKGFINVAGIESPGLSAAPAIAQYVVEIMKKAAHGLSEKEDFNPLRKKVIRFCELSEAEKTEAIKKDPRYGRIICRCEQITEGEIVDAIHRNAGATSLDGVKRRVRPGMGRCQGGFCGPRVMEILSRELGIDMLDIKKDNPSSSILIGKTKQN